MATLQSIRSKGPLLVIVIGLALFAFIAGDAWKVLQPHQGRQDVGEVNGEKLSAQEYQKMVDEFSEVIKLTNGLNSLNEDQLTNVKDQVWNTYVTNQLIAGEAEKLGLTVTDKELQAVIDEGTNPLLMQTPFRNPQTGAFDKDMLKKFLVEYANLGSSQMPAQYVEYYQKLGNFWTFVEKTLRQSLLASKYQNLIAKSLISNPVAAEDAFKGRTEQSDLLLAGVPYASISDSTITVSDEEIKNLYNERKESYKQPVETRDIQYIDVHVVPSAEDRGAVLKEVTEFTDQLDKTTTDYASFVRSTGSTVNYTGVAINKTSLPQDVAARLDSASVNEVYGPYYNAGDDSYNTFKILAKTTAPDSIQFRQIQVMADTETRRTELADSIFNAIKGGADFAEVAKAYGQTGEATWVNAMSWEGAALDADNLKYIQTLINQPVNELKNLKVGQANLILQVMSKKAMKPKYDVAVIKCPVEFSKETYNDAYNKFSQFVAQNTTLEDMKKNAEEAGYTVIPRSDFTSDAHYVGNIHSTQEALRWIFNAKAGEVSPLYECGDNDHMIMVGVEAINKKGYVNINKVANMLRNEIIRNKKAEQLMGQMKDFNSLAQIKEMKDAVSDSVKHVTFNAPAYISVTHASEPAISAYASKTDVEKVSAPIKGNAGVYMIQVYAKNKGSEEFDAKKEESALSSMSSAYANQCISELREKGKVTDQRYLYF
ncbi:MULTISPECIES: peptidylprolyl isomerase [Bacteroides]|uniref:peptidylprolyl isomerase n=1 Tax=Bacteroides TaxID=816 RepID=UPI000B36FE6A|nr:MULTISPECIES: peptidylprolyl isomerase [Bacteroides]MDN0067623.1 SurA N-terminal domain-containing protein [Bacteroides gallinaceum]OUN81122.1 peptidylprolyl isomerase [Bacteroides sp. An51A]OUO73245.1 peptidylprolyl isomerase [Bacteroides sp. An269]OUP31819.1 peptidylprolyl isomerase [Bacteroides sp. An19]